MMYYNLVGPIDYIGPNPMELSLTPHKPVFFYNFILKVYSIHSANKF